VTSNSGSSWQLVKLGDPSPFACLFTTFYTNTDSNNNARVGTGVCRHAISGSEDPEVFLVSTVVVDEEEESLMDSIIPID
jgi:hypothetical protein